MAMQAGAYYIEYRIRKFADYTRKMVEEVGGAIKPYLKTSYNNIRDTEGMEEITKDMDSYSDVMSANIDDILKPKDNVFDRPRSSEPDSQELTDEVQPDENTIQPQRGTSGQSGRGSATGTGGSWGGRTGGKVSSGLFSDFSGEGSDNTSDQQDRTEVSKGNDAGDIDSRGNDVGNREGLPNNKSGTTSKSQGIDRADGVRPETFEERTEKRIKEQTKAEPIPVKLMDEAILGKRSLYCYRSSRMMC